jgi:hypothetical protein
MENFHGGSGRFDKSISVVVRLKIQYVTIIDDFRSGHSRRKAYLDHDAFCLSESKRTKVVDSDKLSMKSCEKLALRAWSGFDSIL